jgi:DNA topoisomerase-1
MREPAAIKAHLSNDQFRLYQLIWQRMVASQMAEAVFENTTVDVEARPKTAKNHYLLRSMCSVNTFPGFIALYTQQKDDDEDKKPAACLPSLETGEALRLLGHTPQLNFTKPPPRYTDATLIKVLEQNGIAALPPTPQSFHDSGQGLRRQGARRLQAHRLGVLVQRHAGQQLQRHR